MKQRWKKIASLMLVTICAFSLTACGKKEETAAYQQITDDMVTNCAEVSQSAVESLAGFDDETLNQMTANRDTFTRLAVSAWMDQENELGKYEEMGTPTTDIDREEGQVTVDIPAKFDKGDAEIKVVFNYSSDYDQMVPAYMTISEVETTGMKLSGAAVNTIMGVGCVFVVLIFLIFVISLFKYIGKIGQKETAPKEAPAPAAPVAAPVEEDLTDDLELVAVISAAIAASENTSTDSFVVRSIKKVNRSKWQRA